MPGKSLKSWRFRRFLSSRPILNDWGCSSPKAGSQTLRASASDPKFLAGVLDFILRDDATVKAFAGISKLTPETVANARETLEPRWE